MIALVLVVLFIWKERKKVDFDVEYLPDNPYRLKKAHKTDACYDIYVPQTTELVQGRQIIGAGFKIAVPYGYTALVCPRSGCSSQGMPISLFNKFGTSERVNPKEVRINADVMMGIIDSGYRGEVGIMVNSNYFVPVTCKAYIMKGTRIAQLMIIKLPEVRPHSVESLSENTDRGTTGYGDSGK